MNTQEIYNELLQSKNQLQAMKDLYVQLADESENLKRVLQKKKERQSILLDEMRNQSAILGNLQTRLNELIREAPKDQAPTEPPAGCPQMIPA